MKKLLWMAFVVTVLGIIFYFTHLKGIMVLCECGIGTLAIYGSLYVLWMIAGNSE